MEGKQKTTRNQVSRWYLFPSRVPKGDSEDHVQAWIKVLLARYGILFRDVVRRETLAPQWGELLPTLRTMEARGILRGGRFISGVGGEQFAYEETIATLRAGSAATKSWVVISASDPLNLTGIMGGGERIPAVGTNRILLRDGEVIGVHIKGESTLFVTADPQEKDLWLRALRLTGAVRHNVLAQASAWWKSR